MSYSVAEKFAELKRNGVLPEHATKISILAGLDSIKNEVYGFAKYCSRDNVEENLNKVRAGLYYLRQELGILNDLHNYSKIIDNIREKLLDIEVPQRVDVRFIEKVAGVIDHGMYQIVNFSAR